MTSKKLPAISHDEIARLAYLNWEKGGRPQGYDKKYWMEAEQQIRATRHLLICELSKPACQSAVGTKSHRNGKLKKPRRLQQDHFFSRS